MVTGGSGVSSSQQMVLKDYQQSTSEVLGLSLFAGAAELPLG